MTPYDAAIAQLILAAKDMLVVWDGVASPSLAYRPGSPAERLKSALHALANPQD